MDVLHRVHPAVVERPEVPARTAAPTAETTGTPRGWGNSVAVDAGRQRRVLEKIRYLDISRVSKIIAGTKRL